MEIVIMRNACDAAALAADAVERLLVAEPQSVIGLATGSSPIPIYQDLIARHRRGALSFAHVRAFLLDEYVGLESGHPEAYRTFIQREFTEHIDLVQHNLFGPDGQSSDLESEPTRYEQSIVDAGGIDLQLLGIGSDGHIGFNEPSSSLGSLTRLKTLTDSTRQDNARFFGGDLSKVPRHVLTQGIGTILRARHLVLIATGEAKAATVAQAIEGPLSSMVPASALQLHPRATMLLDEASAQQLRNADYYREAYHNKPSWQFI